MNSDATGEVLLVTSKDEAAARWATRLVADDAEEFDATGFGSWLHGDPGNQQRLEKFLQVWDDPRVDEAGRRILARGESAN